MHQDLKALRRRLREERCPESVLQQVYRQVSIERAQRKGRHVRLAFVAVAGLIVIGLGTSVLLRSPQRQAPTPEPVLTQAQREQRHAVRMQAGLALTYIGRALNRAGDESRDIILEASLPPLRKGLRTAGEALSNPESPTNAVPENTNS